MAKTDPLALLRLWGVRVKVGGYDWAIPPLPAADWIEAILTGSVIPDLVPGEAGSVLSQMIVAGLVSSDELRDSSREAIRDAAGRDWWEVIRLIGLFDQDPDWIGGQLFRRGFDFEARSIGAYCATVYATAVAGMEKKDKVKFDYQLSLPPVDEVANDEDALSAAFMAAMQQRP